MSNDVFPVLPGLKWDRKRTPIHKTIIKEAVSGREYRARMMASPRYQYDNAYEFLRDGRGGYDELRPLLGFFNKHGGSFDSWLYDDEDDRAVTSQAFGTGDGASTQYQLVRTLGGFVEPVYDINGAPSIYVNGSLKTAGVDYTLNSSGGVTFTVPPSNGALLAWTGFFYWRCRFLQDQLQFSKFMARLFEVKTCSFITVKP